MNILCDKNLLCEAALKVSRAVSSKSPMPALSGILMSAAAGKLTLTGYDLELAMKTTIDVTVNEAGSIVLEAKHFTDIVRRMRDGMIEIEVNERNVCTIRQGKSVFSMIGINADEYPELPTVENGKEVELDAALFSSMIRQTLFCHADVNDAVKAIYSGLFCSIRSGQIRMSAIDGYRVAIRTEKIDNDISLGFICPAKAMSEILKLSEAEGGTLQLVASSRHIIFKLNDFLLISRLIDGEFIDFERFLPAESEIQLHTVMKTADMIDTFDRISPMVVDARKTPVRCILEDGVFRAVCNTEIGTAQDEFEIEMEGSRLEIGFRSNYIMDAVRAADCDQIRMDFKGEIGQAVMKPMEGESFVFIILPIRLK